MEIRQDFEHAALENNMAADEAQNHPLDGCTREDRRSGDAFWQECRDGDPAAWRTLLDLLEEQVRMLRPIDYDEVLSEAVLRLHHRVRRGKPECPLGNTDRGLISYLARVARSAAATVARRRSAHDRAVNARQQKLPRREVEDRADKLQLVWEHIRGLTGSEQLILRLRYEEGLSEREISILCDVSRDVVSKVITIAMNTLRRRLDGPTNERDCNART